MTEPLVSIITVVYNAASTVELCIKSVLAQSYRNIEYIIIDGGSSDGTLEIIEKYSADLAYWVSESDRGIYDAMNKGLQACTGEIVGILNADDWLEPDAIEVVVSKFRSEIDFVYGDAFLATEEGKIVGIKAVEEPIRKSLPYRMPFAHQTLYVSKRIIDRIGKYDCNFRLSSDLDFVCKVVYLGYKGDRLPRPISTFRMGGASGGVVTFLETRRVARKHGMGVMTSWLCFIDSIAKLVLVALMPKSMVALVRQIKRSSYKPYGK